MPLVGLAAVKDPSNNDGPADGFIRVEHGVRPVLVETYVSQPYAGTCYRASNWHYLGQTQTRGAMGTVPSKTPKAVFVYPLQRDW